MSEDKEQWEKVIEYEIRFYLNIEEYKNELIDRYYESQMIRFPVTQFDEDLGRIYLYCPRTETQAIRRIEGKELIIKLLKRATKRYHRLNNAFSQLTDDEINIISMLYLEGTDHLPKDFIARQLGLKNAKNLDVAKERILNKLLASYEKERPEIDEDEESIKELRYDT
jgi:hypothetical protein